MTVQDLFHRHQLKQADLTRAFDKWQPPIWRSRSHYIWHGTRPPSINAILAIHQAYPEIPIVELFQVLKDTRTPPPRKTPLVPQAATHVNQTSLSVEER